MTDNPTDLQAALRKTCEEARAGMREACAKKLEKRSEEIARSASDPEIHQIEAETMLEDSQIFIECAKEIRSLPDLAADEAIERIKAEAGESALDEVLDMLESCLIGKANTVKQDEAQAKKEKPAPVETVKTVRSCNRHDDCDKADEAVKAKGGFAASHCHDECCDECFGA